MPRFKAGDRITGSCKSIVYTYGVIVDVLKVSHNHNYEYVIIWDGAQSFMTEDAGKIDLNYNHVLPSGNSAFHFNVQHMGPPRPDFKENDMNKQKECLHSWKEYVGFSRSFEYCIRCDKKRDSNG